MKKNVPEFKTNTTTKYIWYALGSLCGSLCSQPVKWHRSCYEADSIAEAQKYRTDPMASDIFNKEVRLIKETITQKIVQSNSSPLKKRKETVLQYRLRMNKSWKIDKKCLSCKSFREAPGLEIWCEETNFDNGFPKHSCGKYEKDKNIK